MTNRRDVLAMMAGGALVATSGRLGRAAWQKSPEEMTLPEWVRIAMPAIEKVPVQAEPLATGLKLVTGPGGNVLALDGPDGLILVDSFVPGHGAAILAAVGKPEPGKPFTLINTHWHFDHAGGNPDLAKLGAKILAHDNVRTRLKTGMNMVDLGMTIPPAPPVALPVMTFADRATIHANGETLLLTHVPPAHTDGDVFIHCTEADVLHTGDLFNNGFYPNIDRGSRGWIGGMIAGVDIVLGMVGPKTRIVPGHGPMGSKADLQAFRSMLVAAQEAIEPLLDAGKSLAETIAAKPTARLDPVWGQSLLRGPHFTTLVYNSLVDHRAEVAHGKA